jgi:hypothetical protein
MHVYKALVAHSPISSEVVFFKSRGYHAAHRALQQLRPESMIVFLFPADEGEVQKLQGLVSELPGDEILDSALGLD